MATKKKWIPTSRPIMIASANKLSDGTMLIGVRHWDTLMRDQYVAKYGKQPRNRSFLARLIRRLQGRPETPLGCDFEGQGFIDQFGRWYSRVDAMKIASSNRQIIVDRSTMLSDTHLHSEDLW